MTRWVIYDDPDSEALRPFTWLRPASALLLGTETTEARWNRLARAAGDTVGVACRGVLAPLATGRSDWRHAASKKRPPERASRAASDENGGPEIWVSDLLIPDEELMSTLRALPEDGVAAAAGPVAGFRLGPRASALLAEEAAHGSFRNALARLVTGAEVIRSISSGTQRLTGLADLVRLQEPLLRADLARILAETNAPEALGDGFAYDRQSVRVGAGCRIDYGAVLDAREGPIVLGAGCEVLPHTWVRGPFFAAERNALLGGRIGGATSLGPRCRVRGEVEASVFLGYGNKAHDGFIGHSYLGEWINLGALTTNSDLKNNYSFVQLDTEGGRQATGLQKVGVFLGDHAKTRIGCLLSCGTIVGVGANLFGDTVVASKRIPDFAWGTGPAAAQYEFNKFLRVVETVYGRREVPWTPEAAEALRQVHQSVTEGHTRATGAGSADSGGSASRTGKER